MKTRKSLGQNTKVPSHEELIDAWWCIYNALKHVRPMIVRDYFVRIAFESLLAQCGWKIEEWNTQIDLAKKKRLKT